MVVCWRKMLEILEQFKDPQLVANFQKYFGIIQTGYNEPKETASQNGFLHNHNSNSSCNGKNLVRHRNTFENKESSRSSSVTSGDSSDTNSDEIATCDSHKNRKQNYEIKNKFFFYLFSFGAGLGYEMFYASFFPFWFWNIDGAVGRRVVLIWVFTMYIGQGLKDIICWPRPSSPPVIHLEPQYVKEYGMPSTHAMVGVSVPFSILIYTMHRYEYPFFFGIIGALAWCILVCLSRLYMGMHTVLDLIGGLSLITVLMLVLIPFVDLIDHFQLTSNYSPFVMVGGHFLMAILYPEREWGKARSDTVLILGVGAGVSLASWLNFQQGILKGPASPPPYPIIWPDLEKGGLMILRAMIGILIVIATRAVFKTVTYAVVCFILRLDRKDKKTKEIPAVEFPNKFITYLALAFNACYISPAVFQLLNISRETMYTEV